MPYIGNPIYQSAFVTDQFSGTGSQTAYTMSVAPAGTTNVLVVVSGVVQDPSTYGVSGNTLTFTTAPPSGTGNISCRYLGVPVTGVTTTAYRTVTEFTATAGQTTFTPPSYTVGFINVYLNGVLLGSADYTASNGTTVVLTTGASSGNILTVESFSISSVANAIANAAGSVSSSNIQTSVALTTPLLGTPTSGVMTNVTGLPLTSAVTGVLPIANGGTGLSAAVPVFRAYASVVTSIPNSVFTQVTYDQKSFDTNSFFSTSTSRFTPTIAGYYQLNGSASVNMPAATSSNSPIGFFKNGSWYSVGSGFYGGSSGYMYYMISDIIYFNGTGDYVDVRIYQTTGSTINSQGSNQNVFSGVLVRTT